MAGLVVTGQDTYCLDALVPGRLVSGTALVAQRCYRRLITPRGTLRGGEDEANFGLDLAGFIGRTDARAVDSMLPVVVKNELLKDPAVDAVTVTATRFEANGLVSWTLKIAIVCTDGEVDLIVAASAITIQLLGVS